MKALLKILLVVAALLCTTAKAQQQGNLSATILTAAARTATTVVSSDITNPQWRGGHFIINVTRVTAGTYTPTIQAKDPVSGTYYALLTGTAISATGTTVLKVYPGITASANVSVSDILPRVFRVSLTGAAANMAISVGAFLDQ